MEREEEYMESPDVADNDEVVYCFIDYQRPCSADCVAYTTFPRDNKHLEATQRHCVVIQTAELGARSLNILAGIANQALKENKSDK